MAIAGLLLAIIKRATGIADLLGCKTRQGGLIAIDTVAPAVKGVFVAIINVCITKREEPFIEWHC